MNLWLRLLKVLFKAFRATPFDIWGEGRLCFRVWPNDLDTNLHMNNGRYLTLMDLGRIDLMIRNGVARQMWRRKWAPVAGGVVIRFRRPLDPFQRYTLRTRLLGWDEKWFYFQQTFEWMDGTLASKALVRALMQGQGRSIPTAEVIRAIGAEGMASPSLPPEVANFNVGQ